MSELHGMQLYLNKAVVYRKKERGEEREGHYYSDKRTWEIGRRYNLQNPGGWPQSSLIFKLHGLVKPFI